MTGKVRKRRAKLSPAKAKARAMLRLQEDLALSVEDTALVLGLSRNHVYDLIQEQKAPFAFFMAGRSIRVPCAALRSMLKVEGRSPLRTEQVATEAA